MAHKTPARAAVWMKTPFGGAINFASAPKRHLLLQELCKSPALGHDKTPQAVARRTRASTRIKMHHWSSKKIKPQRDPALGGKDNKRINKQNKRPEEVHYKSPALFQVRQDSLSAGRRQWMKHLMNSDTATLCLQGGPREISKCSNPFKCEDCEPRYQKPLLLIANLFSRGKMDSA